MLNAVTNPEQATASWHTLSVPDVVTRLTTSEQSGLSASEVKRRLEEFGPNALAEAKPESLWLKFFAQFNELVIWILLAAAVLSGFLSEWVDMVAILAIVLLNGLLGFLQEEKAERALAALRNMSKPTAKVIRDGQAAQVPALDLVPGDLIELEPGDSIPADVRLVQTFGVRMQEAALTGESVPVDKDAKAVLDESANLGDRVNMAYMGTVVAAGKAFAVVVATGMKTELGQIAGLLEADVRQVTPLQRRLSELGRILLYICLGVVTVIFIMNFIRGGDLKEIILAAVGLAVAAVPEGLPAVVTLALAVGVQRMVRRNALIRKLPSVETLGCVTVICTDKTGTLTRNEMTVQKVWVGDESFRVTGTGYEPTGDFSRDSERVQVQDHPDLKLLLTAGLRCNHARLIAKENGRWEVLGDPTEGALVVLARKAGFDTEAQTPLVEEFPFDSDRKLMSVVVNENGRNVMFTKGAPEMLFAKCNREQYHGEPQPLDDARRKSIHENGLAMASEALRVLALAYTPVDGELVEQDLIFIGLVGMKDPPRDEVKLAVQRCREAGIRPVMITGDHPATASAIAHELAIADEGDRAVTGDMLQRQDARALEELTLSTSVYARVSPEHKLKIVKALQARGQTVAMTGDGVNDAPAIKAADIGVAMGINGTDVTREAADMVLTDDNFATIVNAVEEGRAIFANIQKVIHYLLSCNSSEIIVMFVAALIGWPVPLLAIQILWINLVTDGLPALALGVEPPEKDLMRQPPRPAQAPVLSWTGGLLMLFHGGLLALAALVGFGIVYTPNPDQLGPARTVAFLIATFGQLAFSLGCRSLGHVMPALGMFSNPYLFMAIATSVLLQFGIMAIPFTRSVFDVSALSAGQWLLVLGLALGPVTIIELLKWLPTRKPAAST